MRGAIAHDVTSEGRGRSCDVMLADNLVFADMLLSERTLRGLHSTGFIRPSPIQRAAIPIARCGTDVIVQAKSGTGKTLVFGIVALEMLDLSLQQVQVLILAPTREIAVQIKQVLTSIAVEYEGVKLCAFIGGMEVKKDVAAARSCHVAIGTPGRVKQLIRDGHLVIRSTRLLVLDEADQLVQESFTKDVDYIFGMLPVHKQTLVVSATFPPPLELLLTRYLVHPRRITPPPPPSTPSSTESTGAGAGAASSATLLVGIRQYVLSTPAHSSPLVKLTHKMEALMSILSSLPFSQCLVFCNLQSRMEGMCRELAARGWPALHLSGAMPQPQRLAAIAALQSHTCRLLLSTDLAARGIDAHQVDLVVNLDLPYDAATYLHRMGRAGRFGGSGVTVTIAEAGPELIRLTHMLWEVAGGRSLTVPLLPLIHPLPSHVWDLKAHLPMLEAVQAEEKDEGESPLQEVTKNSEQPSHKENGEHEKVSTPESRPKRKKVRKKQEVGPVVKEEEVWRQNNGSDKLTSEEAISIISSEMISLPQRFQMLSVETLTEMYEQHAHIPLVLDEQSCCPPADYPRLQRAFRALNINGSNPASEFSDTSQGEHVPSTSKQISCRESSDKSSFYEDEDCREQVEESDTDSSELSSIEEMDITGIMYSSQPCMEETEKAHYDQNTSSPSPPRPSEIRQTEWKTASKTTSVSANSQPSGDRQWANKYEQWETASKTNSISANSQPTQPSGNRQQLDEHDRTSQLNTDSSTSDSSSNDRWVSYNGDVRSFDAWYRQRVANRHRLQHTYYMQLMLTPSTSKHYSTG